MVYQMQQIPFGFDNVQIIKRTIRAHKIECHYISNHLGKILSVLYIIKYYKNFKGTWNRIGLLTALANTTTVTT